MAEASALLMQLVGLEDVLVVSLGAVDAVLARLIPVGMPGQDQVELFTEFVARRPLPDAKFHDEFPVFLRPEVEIFKHPPIGQADIVAAGKDRRGDPMRQARDGRVKGSRMPQVCANAASGGRGSVARATERLQGAGDPPEVSYSMTPGSWRRAH